MASYYLSNLNSLLASGHSAAETLKLFVEYNQIKSKKIIEKAKRHIGFYLSVM